LHFFGIEGLNKNSYVEDSELDYKVCRAAGAPFIALKYGAQKVDVDA
jgi:phosphoglycolate phosphatase-like HAD superfamily hydrolase